MVQHELQSATVRMTLFGNLGLQSDHPQCHFRHGWHKELRVKLA